MKVSVISATEHPVELISMAAGTCFGNGDTVSMTRVESCGKAGHLSVFEHAVVSLRVEGISRACMAQLTRHRLVSFCVESQRYCKYDLENRDDWCIIPPSIEENPEARKLFLEGARRDALEYMALREMGIKVEDARYKLPEAMKTNLVMTCNVRQLFHILDMRDHKAAQWEIRGVAQAMREACTEISKEWWMVMGVTRWPSTANAIG